MMKNARLLAAALITGIGALTFSTPVTNRVPDDWPQWRGKNRDGISTETGLMKAWPQGGPPLAWRTGGAGEGYSSFATAHGRLYTLGARDGNEYVMAFDTTTGKKVWETRNGARFDNDRGGGPRGTPVVDGNQLYVLGASGDLSSIDAASGKVAWTLNVLRTFGGRNIQWGLSESPLVLEDRVLVNAGGNGASIVALRKNDGSVLWKSGHDEAGYSSAVLQRIGSVPQAVFFTAERVVGVDVRDGRELWNYPKVANRTANIATPIVRDDKAFVSSDYQTGAALLQFTPRGNNGVGVREVYFTNEMRNHYSSSVLIGDHLYGYSSHILTAMRLDTGEVAWRHRSVGKGSVIFADDRLYLYGEQGVVGLAEASPQGYVEHGRFEIRTGSLPTWSHPVVSNGKLFLRDQDTVYAYDVRQK
jgi:outer membrane protein assembly factor BamB